MVWKWDIRLVCKALRLRAKDPGQIHYCQLGEAGSSEGLPCGLSIRTATGQCGLQHLHRVLPFVEGGDGVDLQIHACVWGDRNGNLVLSCRSAVDAASGPAYRGGRLGGDQVDAHQPIVQELRRLVTLEATITSNRVTRVMSLYKFALGLMLGFYVGFQRLNQMRFIARDPSPRARIQAHWASCSKRFPNESQAE